MLRPFLLLIIIASLCSCSTATKSTLLGISLGVVGGGLLGSAIGQNENHDDQNKAVFLGAALGGAAGGTIGYYSSYVQDSKLPKALPKLDNAVKEVDEPALNSPVTKKIWIPDKIDGSGTKLEKGHWLYLIERQSTWSN